MHLLLMLFLYRLPLHEQLLDKRTHRIFIGYIRLLNDCLWTMRGLRWIGGTLVQKVFPHYDWGRLRYNRGAVLSMLMEYVLLLAVECDVEHALIASTSSSSSYAFTHRAVYTMLMGGLPRDFPALMFGMAWSFTIVCFHFRILTKGACKYTGGTLGLKQFSQGEIIKELEIVFINVLLVKLCKPVVTLFNILRKAFEPSLTSLIGSSTSHVILLFLFLFGRLNLTKRSCLSDLLDWHLHMLKPLSCCQWAPSFDSFTITSSSLAVDVGLVIKWQDSKLRLFGKDVTLSCWSGGETVQDLFLRLPSRDEGFHGSISSHSVTLWLGNASPERWKGLDV